MCVLCLHTQILERDIACMSIEIAAQSTIHVALSVCTADVQDAHGVAARMAAPDFASKLASQLSGRVRTVQWDVKMVSAPVVVRHTVDDRDKIGCTALHWAALNDRTELMKWLMTMGADKDAKATDGHSPLHWAALKGHIGACKTLLDAGCTVDERDQWQFTPLIRAAQNGHVLVVLLLLRGGADPTLVDEEMHNSLHWAVFHRHHIVVRWLLDSAWAPGLQSCLDAADNRGATALHLAAKKSGREMCRKLLSAGADASLTDAEGLIAAEVAMKSNPARSFNASFLRQHVKFPAAVGRYLVARGEHGRAFYNVPTGQGFTAIICIALAYVWYGIVLLPLTWGRFYVAHTILFVFTPLMWYSYCKSWRGDPGIIPPQPDLVLQALDTNEMSLDELLLAAMCPKLPRAKYSRMFECYVARFDHDCPWISNVVGASNIAHFVCFCYTVTFCLGAWCYVCGGMIFSAAGEALKVRCANSYSNDCDSMSQIFLWSLYNMPMSWLLLFLYTLYVIFTCIMSIVQTKQICTNVTTNEMINWHRYGWERQDGTFKNPYDRGVLHNVKHFFSQSLSARAPPSPSRSPLLICQLMRLSRFAALSAVLCPHVHLCVDR